MAELPENLRLNRRGNGQYWAVSDGMAAGLVGADRVHMMFHGSEPDWPWDPMLRMDTDPNFLRNPNLEAANAQFGVRPADEIWRNSRYDASLRTMVPNGASAPPPGKTGMLHISIHRHDRLPIADWRHMQQIKNELAGDERWAVEVFPPESFLVDTANEYHLWVLPEGEDVPFAFHEGLVTDDAQVDDYNASQGGERKGRQRVWQDGLTTGRNPLAKIVPADMWGKLRKTLGRD